MSFSVVILSFNEEDNIAACIASVSFCDDVVVLDSGSTDRTGEIAEAQGARIVQRAFDDFATQRNYAMKSISFKYDYVFHLDADERFTPALAEECNHVVAEDLHSGFLAAGKLMFLGKWLKYSSQYPCYQLRLVKTGEVFFEPYGHGQIEGEALRELAQLREPFLHYNFSKGIEDWIEKHNRYSTHEALEPVEPCSLSQLLARDVRARRKSMKYWATRIPFQSSLRFLYLYVGRLGFLDGVRGFQYCRLVSIYQYFICLKRQEFLKK